MNVIPSRRALFVSVLLSIAFHLALLLHAQPWRFSDTAGLGLASPARSLHLRMVAPSPPLVSPPQSEAATDAEFAPHVAAPPDAEVAKASSQDVPVSATDSLLPAGGLHNALDYVPSEYLSFVPKPLAPVEIPFPEAVVGEISVHVQLSLFIDETGHVDRVQVDNSQPLSLLQDAAVNTFLTTRFKAGELEGHVVRSLLRVEVIFESPGVNTPGAGRRSTVSM